ncbi:hypothetical protein J14TS5_41140 [Paenibacillus lautus]|uniref:trypsin-like peptidase domain-containing protein n=1 Tax=Paenibacillus lautus TaxID=1401 RepID=UPI001B0DD2B9|nr:trypsin-like peptidase domain-containing protein [Paenibacillus lautus]GIO99028.1 hypothetical protein J14TS5_41140 [Paenibacillus lautus]
MNYFNAKPELMANDQSLISSFKSLQSFRDVCNLLEVTPTHLRYILFEKTPSQYYTFFTISKKSGGIREIIAPNGALKILQEKLNKIFKLAYKPNASIHGFTIDRSIVTNARMHLGKNHLLNFDLADFFPSINFGRVRGVLISFFGMGSEAATVIANICCYKNSLPQGAPTSPILSNMVCFNLDKQLQLVARKNGCTYTRYADDITFSTTKHLFPKSIAFVENEIVYIGPKILKILEDNSFKVNHLKTRLNNRLQHLGVTGITVNKILNVKRDYIKKIRAILRCLEINSLEQAQFIFETKYTKIRNKAPNSEYPSILNVVKGMIDYVGAVKGTQDPIYEKLAFRYNQICKLPVFKIGEENTESWNKKVWVVELCIEAEDDGKIEYIPVIQGTGFFLNDIGFVTNAHVVRDYREYDIIRISRSRYGSEVKKASVIKLDRDRDIAILKIDDFEDWSGFNHSFVHYIGMDVKVIGYPNFGGNDSLYVHKGEILQYRVEHFPDKYNKATDSLGMNQHRTVISARIIAGNSGGPVVNMQGEVVGVATKGFKEISPGKHDDDTATSIMIKIEDVISFANEMEPTKA